MPNKGSGGPFSYGAAAIGRLTYRTAEEARGAADDLGLTDVHSHERDVDGDGSSERVFMPGESHTRLNNSLEERGLPPQPSMQNMSSGKSGGSDPMKMSSDGMNEMMPASENSMSADSDGMGGKRPDGSSMFRVFGDSDDDDEMEIY